MAGSWEIPNQTSMLLGILHVENTTIAWAFGLRNLQIPGHIAGLAGMPYDMARNALCQRVLEQGYEWAAFLDSDVIPPHDSYLRLISHGLPIVSGVYCRRSPPHGIPVMLKGGQWITQLPTNPNERLLEVDLVGAGCLVIHRSVLERLPPQRPGKPFFDWRVHLQGHMPPEECLSEDFTFCLHARRNGYKVVADTSVMCKHVGFSEYGYGSVKPLDATPNT